jgi:23S rRNA (adenine1618-N6)-methyltransferase
LCFKIHLTRKRTIKSRKREKTMEKTKLHPRNKHRDLYDFKALIATCPSLAKFVAVNQYGNESIDFFNPEAVIALNKALLEHFYGVKNWEFPPNYLCPPIPGRADYLHHIADVLAKSNNGKIPEGAKIKCLDIGVGANCIYPIIGAKEYGWSFIGTEIDAIAVDSAKKIVENNDFLKEKVEIRLQQDAFHYFDYSLKEDEKVDFSICNPPYNSSKEEAKSQATRKIRNLKGSKDAKVTLNFGGKSNELWCEGGEVRFIQDMVMESEFYANDCLWFSSLVSKESSLPKIYDALRAAKVFDAKTIEMGQGNKISRIIVWTFLNEKEQKDWAMTRWN